jgi:dipeptidyl aminopeptidase/acylaminoacyl peptidase
MVSNCVIPRSGSVPIGARVTSTPFRDLSDYLAIPRVTGLRLSPDRTWLAASVQTLSADRKKYLTSLWRIDTGGGPARRLTRSAEGEGSPRFLPDGSLLFTSKRPDPDNSKSDGDGGGTPALWLLPAGGGEARVVATLPGGVTAVETAAAADTVVIASPMLQGAESTEDDERLRKERKDAGVSAILHETVPVRYWDHDLGPDDLRLFAVTASPEENAEENAEHSARDITPDAGRALLNQDFALSPDGTLVATGWQRWQHDVLSHSELVIIDVATGKRTVLLADHEYNYGNPQFSPDGRFIVAERSTHHTTEKAHDVTLVLVPVAGNGGSSATDLLPDLDRWPGGAQWDAAGGAVYFTADDGGRHPVFTAGGTAGGTADTAGGSTRVTGDNGAYSELNVADGVGYALRATVDEPPTPVKINLVTGEFERLPAPGQRPELPGTLTEITAEADDGHPIRAWLVLPGESGTAGAEPGGAGPVPMLLWVHGGPMTSWNSWSWRWNPWLLAARGYAVLLPDPALSTGYGQDFVQRGYHSWGDRPFRDIMAVTDKAVQRPDIDETRTAMMGGSYGGYMANWIAGHTGRFKAIVSHAGLWTLDNMFGTTDMPQFWRPQFGDPLTSPEAYEENSPHREIERITTPILVIHGNKDYRVPFGESLRLWWDLKRHGNEAKFLYFPDENHWVLGPGNAAVWYETVTAFLAQHVLGQPWERPGLL